ncbi:TPA: hypothetical protein QDB32_003947 [Burkholderia vietnamiensis]|nr:hypothetical protein [Burkholderia vietnamiensis]HDR9145424.1 hypothetical protein [Burkholderia vietnamiensis]
MNIEVSRLTNEYAEAIEAESAVGVELGLFAVRLSDGGWSIADGEGAALTPADEIELAGWHLPVCFASADAALAAIASGPDAMFDISINGIWAKHCVAHGARACAAYL